MPKVKVDGVEIEVPQGATVLQACELAGKEIPRFCYHERLAIAGNCRMCLVEVKPGPPKPQASCALPATEGQEISTMTPTVRKAREGVMEFLLINHPLDCPICDQGGECDLQDQAMAYGVDTSRYHENKRAVTDKYIGPLVKTSMNRCIQCTRCIRFAAEVAGVPDLGALYRGEEMQITTYLEQAMGSELQANVAVNEEWISDKTRHVVDGLRVQRLDRPFVRENGRLRPATWQEAFATIAARVRGTHPKRIGAIVGDLAAVEEIYALKLLMQSLGVTNLDARQDGSVLTPAHGRASY